jgi:hypothetical protein
LNRFSIEFPRWQYSASTIIAANKEPLKLPELSVLQAEIERYQASTFALFFPILDPSLFQSTINAAYYQKVSTASPAIASARACVFAFHALAIIVLGGSEHLPFHTSLQYAREAHLHFPDIFSEAATVDGLQAILLLVCQPIALPFFLCLPIALICIYSVSALKGLRETFTLSTIFLLRLHD